MKYSKQLTLSLLVCLSMPALAEFTTVARAHEVALSDFRAPASAHGIAAFKSCEDCELLTVRVTPETRYVLNDQSVKLKDFRFALSTVTNRKDETVIVMHHLESDTVTTISITL
jgi:biopolymer transport protein ExbD